MLMLNNKDRFVRAGKCKRRQGNAGLLKELAEIVASCNTKVFSSTYSTSLTASFNKVTSDGLMSNKTFWAPVKPFLSNKSGLTGNEISLVIGDRIVTDDHELENSSMIIT